MAEVLTGEIAGQKKGRPRVELLADQFVWLQERIVVVMAAVSEFGVVALSPDTDDGIGNRAFED